MSESLPTLTELAFQSGRIQEREAILSLLRELRDETIDPPIWRGKDVPNHWRATWAEQAETLEEAIYLIERRGEVK
jgi:hypothetical protein